MGFFLGLRLRLIVFFLRLLHRRSSIPNPDFVLQIPSRDAGRSIKAHGYRPVDAKSPSPVLINFHGSGFVLPFHGSDEIYCRYISKETPFTVLDVQYRLAPENPFPAPVHDVEDVVKYIKNLPSVYDSSHLCISGFSAGANLALAASSMTLPAKTFQSLIAFYPPVDMATSPETKTPPEPTGKELPPWMARLFNDCYFYGKDPYDPRISPSFAPAENFPDKLMIVTPMQDNLADEGADLAQRIKRESDEKEVVHMKLEGCNHAWDKNIGKEDTLRAQKRDDAYAAAAAMLKSCLE